MDYIIYMHTILYNIIVCIYIVIFKIPTVSSAQHLLTFKKITKINFIRLNILHFIFYVGTYVCI